MVDHKRALPGQGPRRGGKQDKRQHKPDEWRKQVPLFAQTGRRIESECSHATGPSKTPEEMDAGIATGYPAANILMDDRDKFPGYTHIALRIASIPEPLAVLDENRIPITQEPVSFGESGQISLFALDPDRNIIELRGRAQGVVEVVTSTMFPK
jgi:catechol 2,3-dioxygenase-like lactoylglutathione lyase family enzyme